MRIEINAGGLGGSLAISDFQSDMSKFITNVDNVISSFKTVKNEIYDVNGGTNHLQEALDNVEARITLEKNRKEAAQKVQKKADDFLDLVVRIDKKVAEEVNRNKEAFYKTNPWLRPPTSVDPDKVWYEQAWDWLCGIKEEIAKDVETAWEWTKDTFKKAWDGIVDFYNEHKKIIDTIFVVVGAIAAIVAVVVTGGAALAPLLAAIGFSASAAAYISGAVAVVAVVSTLASSTLNIIDIWHNVDNSTFNAWQKGLNIMSTVFNLAYSVGNIYNSFKNISPTKGFEISKMSKKDFSKAAEMALDDGTTNQWYLKNLVPKGTKNTFRANGNIAKGFKYEFLSEGKKIIVKWHSTDKSALLRFGPIGGGSGWTAQIKNAGNLLRSNGTWERIANEFTHIPLKKDIPWWWPK